MTREFPDWVYAGALAALPLQTHHRLRRLLSSRTAHDAWTEIHQSQHSCIGVSQEVWSAWRHTDERLLENIHEMCVQRNISVITRHDVSYPRQLLLDPASPAVLFVVGTLSTTPVRRVGIVGTRAATQYGKHFAKKLGRELSDNGICVVSGLARGIDVEAHCGAVESRNGVRPLAVVAGGPDVVYPREHRHMWSTMEEKGAIISEYPPGRKPEAYRFPLRNRILAGLSEVLVVVESRSTGGSMLTVNEAITRGVTVMAVPGSPHLLPSAGTNDLLRDGCSPVTSVEDVMVALGLDTQRVSGSGEVRTPLTQQHLRIIDAFGGLPRTADELSLLTGLSMVDCAVALGRLEEQRWVAHSDGWWEALTR